MDMTAAPTVIGRRCRLLDKLGEGGMGVVYRARDLFAMPADRQVALKRLTAQARDLRFASFDSASAPRNSFDHDLYDSLISLLDEAQIAAAHQQAHTLDTDALIAQLLADESV